MIRADQILKGILHISLGIAVFLLIYFGVQMRYVPLNDTLSGSWEVTANGTTEMIRAPFYRNSKTPIDTEWVKKFGTVGGDTLVVPGIAAGGFRVYINDTLIGGDGDMSQNTPSNIWNRSYIFSFDPSILKKRNTIEIKTHSLYNYALEAVPYIVSGKSSLWLLDIYDMIGFDVYSVAIGAGVIMGIILIMMIPHENKKAYLEVGIALFMVSTYLLTFRYFPSFKNETAYFIFEKIAISSSYLSSMLLLMGIENYEFSRLRISKIMAWITSAVVLVLLLQPTLYSFRQYTSYSELIVIVNFLILLLEVYASKKMMYLWMPATVLFLTVFQSVMVTFTRSTSQYTIGYGVIFLSIGFGLLLIQDYKKMHIRMMKAHRRSLVDPLTGAFNRGILSEISLSKSDLVVIADLDDFKKFNDLYGHQKGDEILKIFSNLVKNSLRSDDLIIRFGGDEFVLILKNCSMEEGKVVLSRVRENLQKLFDGKVSFSYGMSFVSKDFENALFEADEYMYRNKKAKLKADRSYV